MSRATRITENGALEFQCCFCERAIDPAEEAQAVVLNACSLAKWKEGRAAVGQSFYAHATCLIENCKTSYPWEIEVILTEGDVNDASLRVSITRWVDNAQPGFVECEFADTANVRHTFVEKAPVVSAGLIDEQTAFPVPGSIACTILSRNTDGSALIEIELPQGDQRTDVWLKDLDD